MPHCDPDDLALRALGEESGPPETDAHLATCPRCRAELEQLRSVVRTARAGSPDDVPEQPPARVWEGITAELGLGAPAAPLPVADGRESDELAVARQRRARRPVRATGLLVAAAAGGVLAGGLGVWALTDVGDDAPPDVVAQTRLAPLPAWDAEGTAAVEVTADGTRELVVDLAGAASGDHDGFHEVWLLDPEVSQLVSLGVLEGERGTFAIPSGLDLAEMPVVDVSLEPYDGDPAHSGDSVVRGTLEG